MCGEGPKQKP